ncbi:MAG: hypothetical protein IKE15_11440 [Clostridia bacterium]|nr:hypothetical protein [Clostridia bacterium]
MSIFTNPIIVTLSVNDMFVYLQTYDPKHSWSQRFYLTKESLSSQLADTVESSVTDSVTECDLLNVCNVSRIGNSIRFRLFWLHGNYDNDLHGYQQTVLVPVDVAKRVLAGERIKYLSTSPENKEKARIFFTKTASEVIADTAKDKLKRHALRKFFRDHFNYGREEHLVVMEDRWINGFYFFSSTGSRYEGGIVLHEDEVTGKDGKPYRKAYYALHT